MPHTTVFKPRISMPNPAGNPFGYHRYAFRPKLLTFGCVYRIENESGQDSLIVRKRPFALRLEIEVSAAASPRRPLISVRQDAAIQLAETSYTVFDDGGQPLACIRYSGLAGLERMAFGAAGGDRMFRVCDMMANELAVVHADPALLSTTYIVTRADGGMLGTFERRLSLQDKHLLDMSADLMFTLDRRVAVALGLVIHYTRDR